jgi:hypothetical protein
MSALLADKGYDGDNLRGEIVRRGAKPVIPNKSNRVVIHASADALTVSALDRGRGTGLATGATVSVISVIPVASRQDSSLPLSAA